MTLANVSNQILRSDGGSATVAVNSPLTGNGSQQLPLGLAEDYRGADGESLTFNITDVENGHQVNISGIQGSSSFNVLNGQDGANGVNGVNGADGQSVTFDIANIANGHSVTLSGAQGSTSFDVMNGQNGVDGISPAFRFVENEDKVIVFVSGAQGEESFTLYDGETHTYSAGPNIDITNDVISGKDWSDELNAKLDTTAFSLPNSANWNNTYDTVSANSAQWSNDTTYTAGTNIDITDYIISGKDWTDTIAAASAYAASQAKGGVAISGSYANNGSTITEDCSAFGMYEQHNSPGSYQLMATANNASWHGYGYTMSTPENLLMSNVSSVAQNYAASAVSSHIRLIHYPDITFSTVRDTFNAGGIVVPYKTTQGYSTFYSFASSSVAADSTSSYKFNYIGTNGYATILTVSSRNNGAVTGVIEEMKDPDFAMIDATTSYSAIGLYEQFNDPGCYQIFGTAYYGSTPGKSFGYTLPTQSKIFAANCVDSAKNYTNSAISAHIMYVNYGKLVAGDVTFANIRTCINNGGIVIPYEINLQNNNYKIYNYEMSGVNNNTTGYTFGRFEAGGKHQYMVISSHNFGATTGCITANEKLYATPNDVALVDRIVLVATSGDIPASGKTDNKVYIVTGTA